MTSPRSDPSAAWAALAGGNERFVRGEPAHPSQSIDHREQLVSGQNPIATLFGCADSRVAAELIFDQGLGDMFVVRTAGHVIDAAVMGSIEYGIAILDVPLIVVLGHDSCGAVNATVAALESGRTPGGYVRDIVVQVTPSVVEAQRAGLTTADEFEAFHVRTTAELLVERSRLVADRIEAGGLAVVGATYRLSDGRIHIRHVIGDIGSSAE